MCTLRYLAVLLQLLILYLLQFDPDPGSPACRLSLPVSPLYCVPGEVLCAS